jgi:hypothetical protein
VKYVGTNPLCRGRYIRDEGGPRLGPVAPPRLDPVGAVVSSEVEDPSDKKMPDGAGRALARPDVRDEDGPRLRPTAFPQLVSVLDNDAPWG